jgi:hypothetical protein
MSAEMQRRDKEWLRLDCPDHRFGREFQDLKMSAAIDEATLIALGARKAPLNFFEDPPTHNVVTAFAFKTLGYVPDHEKERLRLRPDFPAEWAHATVDNIRIGDGWVKLTFAANDDRVVYTVSQPGGPYPVTLIFEPVLKQRFDTVLIDGVRAELNIAVVGSNVVAPVQLVLDAERRVEFLATKNPPSS